MTGLLSLSLIVAASAADPTAPETVPTWSSEVATIIYENCTTCHRPDGGGPISFTNYEEVRRRANMIVDITQRKIMPPWKVEPGEVRFRGERGLTETEIATLAAWAENGRPLGDPNSAPEPPVFKTGWHRGEPDIVLEMEEDMPVPADGPDIYRDFVVRIPDLPEGKYLKGLEYKPRAVNTAHHTLFSLDSSGRLRARSEATPMPGFVDMDSSLNISKIGGWAVGAVPQLYPDGISREIPPGSDLVLSTHFHPTGKPEVERAQIGLYLTDEPPRRFGRGLGIPWAFGLLNSIRIPASDANYTMTDSFVLPTDVFVYGITPHAHYIAKSMLATAHYPDGRELILINVEDWDFAWQEQYNLAEELFLPEGTRIDVKIVYDNSSANPRNPFDPPQEISWGPESTDEMGNISFGFITETVEQDAALVDAYIAYVKDTIDTSDLSVVLAAEDRDQRRQRFDMDADGTIWPGEFFTGVGQILDARRARTHFEKEVQDYLISRIILREIVPDVLPYLILGVALLISFAIAIRRLRAARNSRREIAVT